jgi:DNA polymerase-3 subunit epsilon
VEQLSFDELDEPLRDVTFVVVDLETTGGVAGQDAITEIGAVKVRGGAALGEFHSLVDPGRGIPPFITVLTGITDAMVAAAPRIELLLGSFLEFARGAVLVAHNAGFDTGFLAAACDEHGHLWPWRGRRAVLDTVTLARRALQRDEVPNCKLGTLARHFGAATQPTHRALDDAKATVDVLHALLERVGSLGVHSLPELHAFTAAVSPQQRRKRSLAADLPNGPGVYIFRGANGEPLYIGTSRNIRSRVRRYFVASETRSRMGEMVGLAERVDAVPCAHALEAQVRELRLIAAHKPRYNRRSTRPERGLWLKLTIEPYPRISVVRDARDDGADYLGPLGSRRTAEAVRDAILDAVPLRQCSDRLSARTLTRAACALAEIGRCGAPCEHRIDARRYQDLVRTVASAWRGDIAPLLDPLLEQLDAYSSVGRYERAAAARDRAAQLVGACLRRQRAAGLTRIEELIAAGPDGSGGWELIVVRHGRLASSDVAPCGTPPMPVVEAMAATADLPPTGSGPLRGVLAEEVDCVLRWLERPGVRLVRATEGWHSPARGAGGRRWLIDAGAQARAAADPVGDRRSLRVRGPAQR